MHGQGPGMANPDVLLLNWLVYLNINFGGSIKGNIAGAGFIFWDDQDMFLWTASKHLLAYLVSELPFYRKIFDTGR